MKIFRKAETTIKIFDDFRCSICDYKLKSGDRLRTFTNHDIDEFCDNKKLDRRYTFEKKNFHTIHNTYVLNICENCFKPKIYTDNVEGKEIKSEKNILR